MRGRHGQQICNGHACACMCLCLRLTAASSGSESQAASMSQGHQLDTFTIQGPSWQIGPPQWPWRLPGPGRGAWHARSPPRQSGSPQTRTCLAPPACSMLQYLSAPTLESPGRQLGTCAQPLPSGMPASSEHMCMSCEVTPTSILRGWPCLPGCLHACLHVC